MVVGERMGILMAGVPFAKAGRSIWGVEVLLACAVVGRATFLVGVVRQVVKEAGRRGGDSVDHVLCCVLERVV